MIQANKYIVRDASVADLPLLVAFGLSVGEDTYLKTGYLPAAYVNGPQREYWSADYLQSVIENDKALLLVVLDGDQLVGMTEVEQLGPDEAVMWKLYVQKAYHGRGIGSRLLQEIVECLPKGVERLKTEYYDTNVPAAGFYKAKGFTFLERKADLFEGNKIPYTYLIKKLKQQSKIY
ncbi:MAG: GNAT family N-acetyltransferase [Chloroflexota bacterium]